MTSTQFYYDNLQSLILSALNSTLQRFIGDYEILFLLLDQKNTAFHLLRSSAEAIKETAIFLGDKKYFFNLSNN